MIVKIPIGPRVVCPFCKQGRFSAYFDPDYQEVKWWGTACQHLKGFVGEHPQCLFDSERGVVGAGRAKEVRRVACPPST